MKDGTRIKATVKGQPCQGIYMNHPAGDSILVHRQGQWLVDGGSIEELEDGS